MKQIRTRRYIFQEVRGAMDKRSSFSLAHTYVIFRISASMREVNDIYQPPCIMVPKRSLSIPIVMCVLFSRYAILRLFGN